MPHLHPSTCAQGERTACQQVPGPGLLGACPRCSLRRETELQPESPAVMARRQGISHSFPEGSTASTKHGAMGKPRHVDSEDPEGTLRSDGGGGGGRRRCSAPGCAGATPLGATRRTWVTLCPRRPTRPPPWGRPGWLQEQPPPPVLHCMGTFTPRATGRRGRQGWSMTETRTWCVFTKSTDSSALRLINSPRGRRRATGVAEHTPRRPSPQGRQEWPQFPGYGGGGGAITHRPSINSSGSGSGSASEQPRAIDTVYRARQ